MFRVRGLGKLVGMLERIMGQRGTNPARKRGRDYRPIIRVISDQIGVNY